MGLSTTDWVAILIFGAGALVGTFGKRQVRITGFVVTAVAAFGLVLSHHWTAEGQGSITNNAPSINTFNQSGGTNTINVGPQRLVFDPTIADQLVSKLPTGKSIKIMAVGSQTDWSIAGQYAQYLKDKGFDVSSFMQIGQMAPPPDHKITIGDLSTSPIVVIIAPSAL
jgi:hypothetical protein